MCREIGQVRAVDVCRDLRAQCHVLVRLDDSCHHIYYLDKLESFTLYSCPYARIAVTVKQRHEVMLCLRMSYYMSSALHSSHHV